jgi:isoquinoline 1-oxidoreductase subunit beta
MMSRSGLDRRSFVVGVSAAGGALTLGFAAAHGSVSADTPADPVEVGCWVVIAPDNTVTIRVARAEMGQGAMTALAMLVAEELECDWAKVRTEFVSPRQNLKRGGIWGDLSTGASRSISTSQDYLRRAGATARDMLITAAAKRWNVPAAECRARNSIIVHRPSGRNVSFGAVAAAAAAVDPPSVVHLKAPAEWTLLGTPQKRLDVRDKITGHPIYAIDVRLPGMLYAAIRHCPVFGGALKSADDSSIQAMPGVCRVVRLEDAVAVVADSWWQANKAVQALCVAWDDKGGAGLSTKSIGDFVRGGLDGPPGQVGRADGDVDKALKSGVRRLEADYLVPFLAHATMEPQTCTAQVRPDGVEIWAPTQDASTALATAAIAAGVSDDKVKVNRMLLGGGFGRRGTIQEFVRQAVLIALEVDAPVKLVWSREEDVAHDLYRPFGMARMVAGLDAAGLPVAWSIRLAGPSFVAEILPGLGKSFVDRSFVSGLAEEMAYDVPNYRIDYVVRETAVPLGVWRGINYTQNVFYKECFVDEMAHAAGIDPYRFRRRLLRNSPKNLAVLDAAAAKAGWNTPPPAGVFRGIAVSEACGSYCAQVAEISLANGRLRVHRVVSALDCGHVVNPLTVAVQTEGSIVYALSAALYGEITIKNGTAEQSNFNDYRMLHLADMPEVDTVIVSGGDFWGGVGEPPVVPLAPALCNAVFAATGQRIRSLPLKNHDLRPGI